MSERAIGEHDTETLVLFAFMHAKGAKRHQDPVLAQIGRALLLIRHHRRLRQADVAKAASMYKGQLSRYENGLDLPRIDSLGRLLRVLQVGWLEFFSTVADLERQAAVLALPEGPSLPLPAGSAVFARRHPGLTLDHMTPNRRITVEELARMVAHGFEDLPSRADLILILNAINSVGAQVLATQGELRDVKRRLGRIEAMLPDDFREEGEREVI
jgi:transcriptional regulator with XRE-family HTH domain